MEGAAYTNKKNVQPTAWGESYFSDSLQKFKWAAEFDGKIDSSKIVNNGYIFRNNQIYLQYQLILSTGDTVHIQERPEFVRNESGSPGLERLFEISGSPVLGFRGKVAISSAVRYRLLLKVNSSLLR